MVTGPRWRDPATGLVHVIDEDMYVAHCVAADGFDQGAFVGAAGGTNAAPTCLRCVAIDFELRTMLTQAGEPYPWWKDEGDT